jgi:hypothetical protein
VVNWEAKKIGRRAQAAKHTLTGQELRGLTPLGSPLGRSVCAPGAMFFPFIADRSLKETQSMLFGTLLRGGKRQGRHVPRRPARPQLRLEWLEPRNLLSVVNTNTDTQGVAHNETTIAVNPTNPQNLIGSTNEYPSQAQSIINDIGFLHAHVTFDGGQTWAEYPIPFDQQLYTSAADPAVAFDADGTAYLAALAFKVNPDGTVNSPDLLVAHSGNGGRRWPTPVLVAAGSGTLSGAGVFNDKDYLAAWGHGNAIVTWTHFDQGPGGAVIDNPIFASVTHDGGTTWTTPAQISGSLVHDQGSVPVVAADGSIHVVFINFDEHVAPQYRDHVKVVQVDPVSGLAVGAPVEVSLIYDGVHDYPSNVNRYVTFQDSEFRAPGFIPGDITADPTNALHLAAVWSDMRNNPYGNGLPSFDPYHVKTNSDVIISQSFDGGQTWSAPTAIQQPNDQFQPWGAYDASGRLQIGYYDRSYDQANHLYGYTLASETTPGSLNFTEQQVTTALSDPTQGDAWFIVTANNKFPNATTFMGDYTNIAITPNGVAAFWTDMRVPSTFPGFPGAGEDAFFALVDPPPPPAAAVLAVPALAGTPPEGGTTNRPGSFLAGETSEVLKTSAVRSALPAPLQNSGIRHATTASVWSLETINVERHLADFSQPHVSHGLAGTGMRSSGLQDDAWLRALGSIADFAAEELQ